MPRIISPGTTTRLSNTLTKNICSLSKSSCLRGPGSLSRPKSAWIFFWKTDFLRGRNADFGESLPKAEGADPVERHKEQFRETDSLHDLEILVHELEIRNDWDGLSEYGRILFERTHALSDGERLATALHNTQEYEPLAEFLASNKTLLEQSEKLRMLYCLSLYHEGALLEARSKLAELGDDWDDPNYRTLHINLGISLGDWNSLSAFVANECKKKRQEKRSGIDRDSSIGRWFGFYLPCKRVDICSSRERKRRC